MTMRLAGVALAAVMACGWASGAEADTLSFFANTTTSDVSVQAYASIDTSMKTATYSFFATQQCGPFISPGCDNGLMTIINDGGTTSEFQISITATGINFPDYPVANYSGFVGNLSFYGDIYEGGFADITAYEGNYYAQGDASITYNLSEVPLPASAPLLGAGLLALGGIGYAQRRRSRSAQAA